MFRGFDRPRKCIDYDLSSAFNLKYQHDPDKLSATQTPRRRLQNIKTDKSSSQALLLQPNVKHTMLQMVRTETGRDEEAVTHTNQLIYSSIPTSSPNTHLPHHPLNTKQANHLVVLGSSTKLIPDDGTETIIAVPASPTVIRSSYTLRRLAIDASLYINLVILVFKLIVYLDTLSLSVLAALIDSALDVVSQLILNYTEKRSSLHRSSALYPAGASRLEPLGVLTCAALMGMASFEVLKESIQALYTEGTLRYSLTHVILNNNSTNNSTWTQQTQLDSIIQEEMDRISHFTASFWGMIGIIAVKYGLWLLCKRAAYKNQQMLERSASTTTLGEGTYSSTTAMLDPTLDALAQDHKNDCLSNIVAAVALLSMLLSKDTLWFFDPLGALIISVYIIHSWYETAKEQIEQLTGKCAPVEFIDELYTIATTFDPKIMLVDVGTWIL